MLHRRTMKSIVAFLGSALAGLAMAASVSAEAITISADKPGARFNPLFYGLMTEEINYSYDGGLYAELIQNRIFRNPATGAARGRGRGTPQGPQPAPIPHWSTVTKGNAKAAIATDTTDPMNTTALTTSLKLTIDSVGAGERAGVANDGFWGIPIKPSTAYKASFYAKAQNHTGPLNVSIESLDGNTVYASGTIPAVTDKWQKYALTLTTGAEVKPTSGSLINAPAGAGQPPGGFSRGGPQPTATIQTRFVISSATPGTLWFNLVSLMPPTYKNRPNGMRPDIMQLLADMKPGFLRFPGGNYLEGPNFENRFNWKATIGPLEDRPGHQSPWNYRSSDGVGLLEFLQWAEDIGAEPVVGVYAGLHIDGGRTILTGDALKPHVQDALDEIEYITGDASTTWGARRAKDGHPAPFKLNYVEIGNEDWLNNGRESYDGRFGMFYDAIKAKYPSIKVISSGPNLVTTRTPDVIDEHYYMNVQQALTQSRRYDNRENYTRAAGTPKIFVGEWATRDNRPTAAFNAALADAAFLTGMERNADLVIMTCYAPLFVNVNPGYPQYPGGPAYPGGQQWATDLIGYDSLTSFGGTAYYVQKLFYTNRGDVVLPNDLNSDDIYASTTRDDATGEIILKLVCGRGMPQTMEITLQGVRDVDPNAAGWILTGGLEDVNSLTEPAKVAPKPLRITNAAPKFTYELPANSIVILRLKPR